MKAKFLSAICFAALLLAGSAQAQEIDMGSKEALEIVGAQMGHADAALNCPNSNQNQIFKDQSDYKDQADQIIFHARRKVSREVGLKPFRAKREQYAKDFAGKCKNLRDLHSEWFH